MSKAPLYCSGCIATERPGDDLKDVQDFYLHVKDTIWHGLSYVCRVLSTAYSEIRSGWKAGRRDEIGKKSEEEVQDKGGSYSHGGVRHVHQMSNCLTQSTVGPYVVQIWSLYARNFKPTKTSSSTERKA